VPDEWVDLKSLVGPPARIRERYRAWEASGADSLSVRSRQPEAIEVMAKAARLNSILSGRMDHAPATRGHYAISSGSAPLRSRSRQTS